MSYWDTWKSKLGLVKEVSVTKLETTPYNPPPPGSMTTWSREKAQATPGSRSDIEKRSVNPMKLVTSTGMAPMLTLFALFPARKVVTKQLQVSHFVPQAPGTPAKGAIAGRRDFDPYGDFNFVIEIEGLPAGAFQKVDGLNVDIDTIEYKDSLDPHPHKRPGIHRFGNIKLTKGVVENTALWDWCCAIMAGKVERRNGSIRILDDSGDKEKPETSFDFFQAWPCKWSGLRIDGKGGATLVEELELAIDSFTKGK